MGRHEVPSRPAHASGQAGMRRREAMGLGALALVDILASRVAGGQGRRRRDHAVPQSLPAPAAALVPLSVVLGRPTDRRVTANVLAANDLEAYIEYRPGSDGPLCKTVPVRLEAGSPAEILLDRLQPNARCAYRLCTRRPGEAIFEVGREYAFHTQRAPGSPFAFEIQGDSHPERPHQHDAALYARTLLAAEADRPDFYLTLGDDFSVDRLGPDTVTEAQVAERYLLQRPYLGLAGRSAPVFLVGGNHEQAARCNLDGTPDNVAVWAQNARNRLFPQPAPDGFYTGDAQPVEFIGLLRDYYAWTWGDALFVVIDPYWHSPGPVDNVFGSRDKKRDMWAITLGDEQYRWLERTLKGNRTPYTFVFTHHVLGTGRGGVECAGLYEWGGKNKRGDNEFARKRPAWPMPVHDLMAASGVTVFFQGHDHVFARQQRDGVVYQTLPEPADPNYALYNKDAYRSGTVLPNSGRVRVTVSPEQARVEYVRSYLPKDATSEHPDGEVAFAYTVAPRRKEIRR